MAPLLEYVNIRSKQVNILDYRKHSREWFLPYSDLQVAMPLESKHYGKTGISCSFCVWYVRHLLRLNLEGERPQRLKPTSK